MIAVVASRDRQDLAPGDVATTSSTRVNACALQISAAPFTTHRFGTRDLPRHKPRGMRTGVNAATSPT